MEPLVIETLGYVRTKSIGQSCDNKTQTTKFCTNLNDIKSIIYVAMATTKSSDASCAQVFNSEQRNSILHQMLQQ